MTKKIYVIKYGMTDSHTELNWDATLFATSSKEKADKIVEIIENYIKETRTNWSIESRDFENKLTAENNLRRDAKRKLCEVIDTDRYDQLLPREDEQDCYYDFPNAIWIEELITYD